MKINSSPFRRVTIIGVGLIGGSLGLAIKRKYPSAEITGIDRPEVLRRAKKRGAIDKGYPAMKGTIAASDLIVLATPLSGITKILPLVAKHSSASTTVTDVGSVKSEVMRIGEKLFPGGNFIGGHPMAGGELSGIEGAHPLLFENACWVLTPATKTNRTHLQRLSIFLKDLGARVLLMESHDHDGVASALSHLPQLAAVALMNVAGRKHPVARKHLRLAAGGFRDMTRIASSPYAMWADILRFNSREIKASLRMFIGELQRYARHVDAGKLQNSFAASRRLRNTVPKNMKGFLHPLIDVFVFVKDRPGVLAQLTGALARAQLNINDVELVKVREGNGGTLRLSFATREIAEKARTILRRSGFDANDI